MAATESDDRLLLRLPEVAIRLSLGRSTVYELIQRGDQPVVRVGRAVRVPVPGDQTTTALSWAAG